MTITTRRGFLKGLAGLGAALTVPFDKLVLPPTPIPLAPVPTLVVPERRIWALDRTMAAPHADFTPASWTLDEQRPISGRDLSGRGYYGTSGGVLTFTAPLSASLPQLGDRVTIDLGAHGRVLDALITDVSLGASADGQLAIELRAWTRAGM
jgi:hypothetical protein